MVTLGLGSPKPALARNLGSSRTGVAARIALNFVLSMRPFAISSPAKLDGYTCKAVLTAPTSILRHRRLVAEMTRKLTAKATAGGDGIGHSLNAVHILFLLLLNALLD